MKAHFTIEETALTEYIINKSRFIGHIAHVETVEEAMEFINMVKKEHYTARHNCYAYILGENEEIQKASDDGEPSGTAGIPILEVIKKHELTNVVIVVTRYFGGIKLGAGGLIRAYSHSAALAIQEAQIIHKCLMQQIPLQFSYDLWNSLENFLKNNDIIYDNLAYTDIITCDILLPLDDHKTIEQLNNLSAGRITIGEARQVFYDIPQKKSIAT